MVSGLYEEGIHADSGGIADQAELNGGWMRAWSGWLCCLPVCLAVSLRGDDDIRKAHRGGCAVVESMQTIVSLAMRLMCGLQVDVLAGEWRVQGWRSVAVQ